MHDIDNIYIHHTTYWENTRYVWRINIDPRCALYHIHPPLLRVYQFFVHILYEIQRVAWTMLCKRCSGQFCTTVQSSAQTTTNWQLYKYHTWHFALCADMWTAVCSFQDNFTYLGLLKLKLGSYCQGIRCITLKSSQRWERGWSKCILNYPER